jgi:hypothetical protein
LLLDFSIPNVQPDMPKEMVAMDMENKVEATDTPDLHAQVTVIKLKLLQVITPPKLAPMTAAWKFMNPPLLVLEIHPVTILPAMQVL